MKDGDFAELEFFCIWEESSLDSRRSHLQEQRLNFCICWVLLSEIDWEQPIVMLSSSILIMYIEVSHPSTHVDQLSISIEIVF